MIIRASTRLDSVATASMPHRYPDSKAQPHLRVAKAMLKEGRAVNVGDHIPYVICLDEHGHSSNKGVAERTVHPDHVDPDTTAVDKRPGMEKEGAPAVVTGASAIFMISAPDSPVDVRTGCYSGRTYTEAQGRRRVVPRAADPAAHCSVM
jgi:hypothetical protein